MISSPTDTSASPTPSTVAPLSARPRPYLRLSSTTHEYCQQRSSVSRASPGPSPVRFRTTADPRCAAFSDDDCRLPPAAGRSSGGRIRVPIANEDRPHPAPPFLDELGRRVLRLVDIASRAPAVRAGVLSSGRHRPHDSRGPECASRLDPTRSSAAERVASGSATDLSSTRSPLLLRARRSPRGDRRRCVIRRQRVQ